MPNDNICKFNISLSSDLVCDKFVYETTDCQKEPLTADSHVLGLVVRGSGVFKLRHGGGDGSEISQGDLFLICRGDTFSIEPTDGLEYCYISFGGRRADELIERLELLFDSRVFRGYGALTDFWLECLHKADRGSLDLFSEAVLLYSLAHFKPRPQEQKSVITRIMVYTSENYTDPNMSLGSMAQSLGYDAKYLSFQFKKKKGISFTAYLRDLRIRHALFLFEQGITSVKNAALMSGFLDALYFSKVFKQEIGLTPSEFIKKVSDEHQEN